ncbi:MAG: hypothetical protein JW709_12335 [Sedimentisphaerales bacterium]|nr:hypothetical protein [Sedimentisphaerales bacterium]
MRAQQFSDLLKAQDRVAVSNITGREASAVCEVSQRYCSNIVGGWALGKGGQPLDVQGGEPIPVFASAEELMRSLPAEKLPNKIIVYSPPTAVYGEVKEIIEHGKDVVETLFIITEHVSIEVTAKIAQMCAQANIDVLGCNTLGMINAHDGVRVGAVGGDSPVESFRPGSVAIISNSGNMVNTMASYLQSAGLGTSYGLSTGKDVLILTPLKDILKLALADDRTKLIVLYIEPGGLYEKQAVEMLRQYDGVKPIIAYVTGEILQAANLSLGHAGAVVEGNETTAKYKKQLFDEYFGVEAFKPGKRYGKSHKTPELLKKGIRIQTLHHLPLAAAMLCDVLKIEKDFRPSKPATLNPWFLDYKGAGKHLPSDLLLHPGTVPEPFRSQIKLMLKETWGATPTRRSLRNASHASANDGRTTSIYGYPLENEMCRGSFAASLWLAWTGFQLDETEVNLFEKCLIASLSNGPGTISAQGAKLSTSAGNAPNTAMIATLACIGDTHGGNGRQAVKYLLRAFRDTDLQNPYDPNHGVDLAAIVTKEAQWFNQQRNAAKEAGADYERIPCLGHPVFRNDPVNYDPREQVIAATIKDRNGYNIFLEFYHLLARRIKEIGVARNVWAVNLDGAIACVVLAACWRALRDKTITVQRVGDIAFLIFALGRVGGAAGEFLDHQDFGTPMDMRIPVDECLALTRLKG